ncbi:hypothetical protein HWV62_40208 [Athelia sp. TMB]|nr:hypothetical protein HWV62_40208 [Athelia sp. TMB]
MSWIKFPFDPDSHFNEQMSEDLLERLREFILEIVQRAQREPTYQQNETGEAWNALLRTLGFDDEADPVPLISREENFLRAPEEGHHTGANDYIFLSISRVRDITDAGPSLASSDSVLAAIMNLSQNGHHRLDQFGLICVRLSLNPSGRATGSIPEEPPIPLSYWIDLHPVEDSDHDSISTAAPEPNSLFLNLQQLDDLAPEVPPSPVDLTLDLRSE